jgi:hypothetical protein
VFERGPVQPVRGGYRLSLRREERDAIGGFCAELRELVEAEDVAAGPLFPRAYRDDERAADEYDSLVRGELVAGRLAALETVERTLDADLLDERQLEAWCGALNDLRLVLGERIGVGEEFDAGRARRDPDYALYGWLSWLQEHVVEALRTD